MRAILIIWSISSIPLLWAQCPVADFSMPANVCSKEPFIIQNNSTNATTFEWDYCGGDLDNPVGASTIATLSNLGTLISVEAVNDGFSNYLFVIGSTSNELVRISLGTNMRNSSPTITNLGNLGGKLNGPIAIKFIQENGNWYGILYNSGDDKLLRIHFGTSIANQPELVEPVITANGGANCGLDVVNDNGILFAFITNPLTNSITTIRFGNSILNNPNASTDVVVVGPISGADYIRGLNFFKVCGNWYAFAVTSLNNKIYRLSYGSDLLSTPTFTDVTGANTFAGNLYDIKVFFDNDKFLAFASSVQGNFYKFDFQNDITSIPTSTNIGNFGILSNTLFYDFLLVNSEYSFFVGNYTNGQLYRCDFLNNCSLSSTNPLVYNTSGLYAVNLKALDQNGNVSYTTQQINVSSELAPPISFVSESNCVGYDVNFNSTSPASLASYNWSFGDGQISNASDPVHQFVTSGAYSVSLSVTDMVGCNNFTQQVLKIYDKPVPQFDIPSGLICTNNQFTFNNNTVDNFDGLLTNEWFVNSQSVSTAHDLQYTFNSSGDQQIKLVSSIPGCSNELVQTLNNVLSGPIVGFDFLGKCEGETISFINQSTGAIAGYEWDLGNGITSTLDNPKQVYAANGTYSVTLNTTGTNGCVSTQKTDIPIYSTPQPNFYIDTPPFSCAGSPTQFHDNTAAMTDSNVAKWAWAFNDGTGSTSNLNSPTYTYQSAGSYLVDLEVETNYGCKSSVTLPITISSSPTADFSYSAACIGKSIVFNNSSSPGSQLISWTINGSAFTSNSPSYTFQNTGNYNASISVKGNNGCVSTKAKVIQIKPIPTLDFTNTPICSGQNAEFSDNSSGSDLPNSWSWDFGSGNIKTGSPVSYSFPSVGNFPVKMSVVTQAGCNYTLTKNVFAAYPPIAEFTSNVIYGPPPLKVQFTNQSQNASGLLWKFNDAASSTSGVPNPLFVFDDLGDYDVVLIASNSIGCQDIFTRTIHIVNPNIDLILDDVKVSASQNSISPTLTISNNSNVPIEDIQVIVTGADGSQIETPLKVNLQIGETSEFLLPVTFKSSEKFLCFTLHYNANSFLDKDILNNTVCVNLTEQTIFNQPYPNPSNGEVVFEVIMNQMGSGTFKIFNVQGKQVFKETFPDMIIGLNQLKLDLSGSAPGLYLALWEVNGTKSEYRFILK